MKTKLCSTYHLGMIDYQAAWQLQKQMAEARGHSHIDDSLLLLEHPHTYTLGSSGKMDHLLMSEAERSAHHVAVHRVDRGGDITYHGPGQLVGYPIIKLDVPETRRRIGVVDYIRRLEAVLIKALTQFGIEGERLKGYTGVWVSQDNVLHKIAAIGVKVTSRAVTTHGFALNVNTDMRFFEGIIPCGISDKPVISMTQIIKKPVNLEQVINAVETAFEDVFAVSLQPGDADTLLTQYSIASSS